LYNNGTKLVLFFHLYKQKAKYYFRNQSNLIQKVINEAKSRHLLLFVNYFFSTLYITDVQHPESFLYVLRIFFYLSVGENPILSCKFVEEISIA
jgi:hypothetical protein